MRGASQLAGKLYVRITIITAPTIQHIVLGMLDVLAHSAHFQKKKNDADVLQSA